MRLLAIVIVLSGIALVVSLPSGAFTLQEKQNPNGPNARWATRNISYYVNEQGSDDLSMNELLPAIHNSFVSWSDAGAGLTFAFNGLTAATLDANDGQNTIFWDEDGSVVNKRAFAVTTVTYNTQTNEIVDADIAFNGKGTVRVLSTPGECGGSVGFNLSGIPLVWNVGQQGLRGSFLETQFLADIQATATHEIGHLLGLNHSEVPNASMSTVDVTPAIYCTTTQATLKDDDIDGIRFLYPVVSSWPMFHQNAQHTGRTASIGISDPRLRFSADISPIFQEGTIGPDGQLYFNQFFSRQLVSINKDTGTLNWSAEVLGFAGSPAFGSPALSGDGKKVFVAANQLFTVDASDGTILNSFGESNYEFTRSVVVADSGNVYAIGNSIQCPCPNAKLFSFTHDGSLRWAKELAVSGFQGTRAFTSPVISKDGKVLTGSFSGDFNNSRIFVFSEAGDLLTSFNVTGQLPNNFSVGPDNNLYFVLGSSRLASFTLDGSLRWELNLFPNVPVFSDLSVDSFGNIYLGSHVSETQGSVISVSSSGSIRWSLPLGGPVDCVGAIDKDDNIYIGTDTEGALYSLTNTGTIRWKLVAPNTSDIVGCPILNDQRMVFFTTNPNRFSTDFNRKLLSVGEQ